VTLSLRLIESCTMLLRAAASASRLMFSASQYVCDMDLSNVPRTPSARHDSLRRTTTTQQRCKACTSRLQTGPESGDETNAQDPVHTLFQTAATTCTLTYDAPRAATALGSDTSAAATSGLRCYGSAQAGGLTGLNASLWTLARTST
jgi:hypothetical protein